MVKSEAIHFYFFINIICIKLYIFFKKLFTNILKIGIIVVQGDKKW